MKSGKKFVIINYYDTNEVQNMKKIKIYILIAVCFILGIIAGFSFYAYQQHTLLEETTNEYIHLYMNASKDYKQYQHITPKEAKKITTSIEKTQIEGIRDYFKSSGLSVNDKQIQEIYTVSHKFLSSLSYHTKIQKKSSSTVIVTVTCPQINVAELEKTATKNTLAKIDKNNIKKLNDSSNLFVQEVVHAFETYNPSKETKTITFTLKKQASKWKLEDINQFIVDMDKVTINGWR